MEQQQYGNEYGGGGSNNYGGHENYDYDQSGQQQQRAPPSKYQVRPQVDPDAEGEVDPNL